jgi:hypothetical protein
MKVRRSAATLLSVCLVIFLALVYLLPTGVVSAAQITIRTLTLQAGASVGGSDPGGVVNHQFTYTVPTTATIGSIQFLYCTTASGACTTPIGLVTTAATMGTQSGATGFTIVNTTNGAPYITRSAASITGGTALTDQLLSVTNPTAANQTFYVRITTFTSTTATTGATDTGSVAASTANQITLTGTMPESLIFCTGQTVGTTAGIPDCTTAASGAVLFGTLFSPTAASTATSQMAASTNAGSGYVITVSGVTLTSGSNTIPALTSAAAAAIGNGQFGMNLVANTTASSTPAVGTAVAPAANGTSFKGQGLAGYNTADTFKYNSGDTVANSANGGAGPTNAQIYTVSYIVNVTGSQAAGTYTTTLTYVCTGTF